MEKIDLKEGDISNLESLGDEAFSFVVCLGGTLSYVLEKGQQAIRELVRVAKRDAFIIIGCDSKWFCEVAFQLGRARRSTGCNSRSI